MYQRCLKRDPYFKNAGYNLAATLARAEVYDGTAVSAIAEFESLNHYQLPDNSEGEEKLYAIQGEVIRNEEISAEGETAGVKDESLMDFLEDHLDGEKVEEPQANDIQEKKETSSESSSESQEKERKVEIAPEACFKMISENHKLGNSVRKKWRTAVPLWPEWALELPQWRPGARPEPSWERFGSVWATPAAPGQAQLRSRNGRAQTITKNTPKHF